MFREYYNYKIKTVYEYSILLTKIIGISKNKLWHRKKDMEDSLDWIIKDYFSFMFSHSNTNVVRCFITDKNISKYKIEKELLSVINYFIEHKRGFEIKAFEKEIILCASIIHIANELDIATSPYKINKNNYKTILTTYLEKFNKIEYFSLIDEGRKNTNLLLELIKTNVKKERRIFEHLTSKVSFNKYIDISKDNKYYLTQYNYSIQSDNKINDMALKYIYEKDNIDKRFVLISKDLIIITLMKLFSIRKLRKIFFLPIKADFYRNENNIKELSLIYKDRILSKYIKVLLNYNDFNEEFKELLGKYHIDYYIYCSKSSKISDDAIIKANYLLSRDFNNLNADYVRKMIEEGNKVIIEEFDGIVQDNDLLKESEEL
jgi:hypothetical protein